MKILQWLFRNAITLFLLYHVWQNVHWSVATLLTFQYIAQEILSIGLLMAAKALNAKRF